jgi:hypothetical protein
MLKMFLGEEEGGEWKRTGAEEDCLPKIGAEGMEKMIFERDELLVVLEVWELLESLVADRTACCRAWYLPQRPRPSPCSNLGAVTARRTDLLHDPRRPVLLQLSFRGSANGDNLVLASEESGI